MITRDATYPNDRKKCGFGIRYIKALMASDAVLLHGSKVVALAVWIVSQEDRLHYTKPVSFWRSDIESKFGFHRNEATADLLKSAVDSGLVYRVPRPKGYRGEMEFWVTIPDWLNEYMPTLAGSENGTSDNKTSSSNGTSRGTSNGTSRGTIPIPFTHTPINVTESNSDVIVSPPHTRKQSTVEGFDDWYQSYPRRVGRNKAEKAYVKAIIAIAKSDRISTSEAVSMLATWSSERLPSLKAIETQFIPHPATWLNDGRYRDEIATMPACDRPELRAFRRVAQ